MSRSHLRILIILAIIISAFFAIGVSYGADIRVRITWGGDDEMPCFGQISCTAGGMSALTPLGAETDDSGNVLLVGGQMIISQPVAKVFNGVNVTLPWDERGVLRLQLSPSPRGEGAVNVDVPLTKLISETFTVPIPSTDGGKSGNRVSVRRVPGDTLRVLMERDNLVFSPGETFRCEVVANFPPISEKADAKLSVQVLRGRETFEVHRNQYDFSLSPSVGAVKVNIPLPQEEGAFDIIFSVLSNSVENPLVKPLTRPLSAGPLSGTALDPTKVVMQRRVQVMMLAAENRTVEEIGNLSPVPVLEIDPTLPKWWETMNRSSSVQIPRWSRTTTGSLGSGDAKIVDSRQYGRMMELPNRGKSDMNAADVPPEAAFLADSPTVAVWEAYPLALERVGMPHILEVEYPAGVEQTLGISILEPNVSGAILPMGIDSGVNVPAQVVETDPQDFRWERHRIIFWPKSKTPIVLLTNRHASRSAFYGKMRILSAGNNLPRLMPRTASAAPEGGRVSPYAAAGDAAGFTETDVSAEKMPHRLIMPMFARPIFPDFFSATKMPGGSSEFTLSDWITFYDGGKRMAEYLNYVGYNGIVLSVYADGGAIYPSRILSPTPRYDSGAFFTTAQDPVPKDVAEMLFRIFDREKLTLIPAMDFSSPIAELEAAARSGDPGNDGFIRWRNAAGAEITEKINENHALAPGYNILHPRVQKVVLDSIAEVIGRYGHHPSFGGISLQLVDNSILLMPGPQWGMDPHTLRLFAQETGLRLPESHAERVRYLSQGEGLQAWLKWRAGKLSFFYRRVATLLAKYPRAKLYLVGTDLLNESAHPELHPRLGASVSAADVLLYAGLDMDMLSQDTNIVFPRPQRISPMGSLAASASGLQWQNSPGTYRIFQSQATPGTVFYHTSQKLRLPQFDKVSPYQPTYTWGKSQFTPAGSANRRRFAESLAMMDADVIIDGGWTPAIGQEDAVRMTIRTLRQLPPERFRPARMTQDKETKSQPVIFRSLHHRGENIIYAINRTQFVLDGIVYVRADGSLRYGESVGQNATLLEDGRPITLDRDGNGYFWRVTLAPYQIVGIRLPGPAVALFDPVINYAQGIRDAFHKQVSEMTNRLKSLNLEKPTQYMGLRNAGFEDMSTNPEVIPQWQIVSSGSSVSPGAVSLDRGSAHTGNTSLRMRSASAPVKIVSQSFTATPTGRMCVSFWVHSSGGACAPLNIILEGDRQGTVHRRVMQVSPSALAEGTSGNASGWRRCVMFVNDLPLENLSRLRLGFELTGPGEVRIDTIQLSDMTFSDEERRQLGKVLEALAGRFYANDLTACVHSLESYWGRFLMENIQPLSYPDSEGRDLPTAEIAGIHSPAGGFADPSRTVSAAGGSAGNNDAASGRILPRLPSLPPPPPLFTRQNASEEKPAPETLAEKKPEKKKKSMTEKMRGFFHL